MAHRNHAVVQNYLFLVVENFVALPMPNHRMKLDVIGFHRDLKEHAAMPVLYFFIYISNSFMEVCLFSLSLSLSLKVTMIERKHRKWERVESSEELPKNRGL